MAKPTDYVTCGSCTHTQNIHVATGQCGAYGCRCPQLK